MLWSNKPGQEEKRTPWVIGVLAILLFAVATLMNYGRDWFRHHTPTDVSAASTLKESDR